MKAKQYDVKSMSARTHMLANMAMMLAVMIALTMFEHMLPPIPMLPPSVRLGLSNIVTMYMIFFLGRTHAVALSVLKSVFVLLVRGATAGILSLCGGLSSIGIIVLLVILFRSRVSYLILSVAGAITHNFAQIIAASFILSTNIVIIYWPVLLVSGVVLGSVTGTLLRVVMPYLNRFFYVGAKKDGKGNSGD